MKMSIREATLNLQKPCTSARIAPWLAVMCWLFFYIAEVSFIHNVNVFGDWP
jgi:hypothetical protein